MAKHLFDSIVIVFVVFVCFYFFCFHCCLSMEALRHGIVAISCTFSMLQQMFSQVLPSHTIAIVAVVVVVDIVVIECNKRHISI